MNGSRKGPSALTADQQKLVEGALPTARMLARMMASKCPGFECEELYSIAAAELTLEVQRYDSTRGTSLAQFALKAMVGEILRTVKKQASAPLWAAWMAGLVHAEGVRADRDLAREIAEADQEKLQRSHELGEDFAAVMFLAYMGKSRPSNAEDELIQREFMSILRDHLSTLERDDAALLEMLYWEDLGWEETAAQLGESVSSAQRRERRLLPRLRAALEAKGIRRTPSPAG